MLKYVLPVLMGAVLLAMPLRAAFADEPVPNASVAIKDSMGKVVAESKTDAMGHFMIGVLPPGPCSIEISSVSWGMGGAGSLAATGTKATPHTLKITMTEVLVTSVTKLPDLTIAIIGGSVAAARFNVPDLKPPMKGLTGSVTLVK